jgi:hypothetical protein
MLKRTIVIAAVFAMLPLYVGCGDAGNLRRETLLDQNWGRSVESAKYNQYLDPEAGKDPKTVEGLSGEAAGYSVDNYQKSFKSKTLQEGPVTTTMNK